MMLFLVSHDTFESMAFRRRGYERDALLQAVISRAGFKDLVESEEAERGQEQPLATLPEELGHFSLDNFRDRAVQADLVALLLLPKGDPSFASCVLVHGMGGTGKTVTAVAVLQEVAVRAHFSDFYWVTVGADAVDERMKELMGTFLKQLTGTFLSSEEASMKNEQDLQQMLVQAMVKKRRALVVLDDPWVPEQVRLLNPIDGSHTQHRLLVTTRMRDLVPKATRVELPLMGEEEAVALLMDLANVEEASYLKDNPGSAWPPQAAFAISAECGLLPITLLIAAQVIRSWGSGWEEAVLPLLREERGSGTSTVEERVIGAGLQALKKNEDGPAVKKLFYAFAVTQEDFVHPIAVVELLWRSCCASESEKQQNSLAARLKVRQRTQLLVDHSLLLGSSSEGVHLHDIVLTFLRKRLSAAEMRAEQRKVVEGMVAASSERVKMTGRGLFDTGTTDKAALAVGAEGLATLAADYAGKGANFKAAKVKFLLAELNSSNHIVCTPLLKESLQLLENDEKLESRECQQLQWDTLSRYQWVLTVSRTSESTGELEWVQALQAKVAKNPKVAKDPVALYLADMGKQVMLMAIGSRREFWEMCKNVWITCVGGEPQGHGTVENTKFMQAYTNAEWGNGNMMLVKSLQAQRFERHHIIGRKCPFGSNMIAQVPAVYVGEKEGSLKCVIDTFSAQHRYLEAYCSSVPTFSGEDNFESNQWGINGEWAGEEMAGWDRIYPFRAKLLRICKLTQMEDVQEFAEGLTHAFHPHAWVTNFFAMRALTSPATTDMGYLETLPPPDSTTFFCVSIMGAISYASARGLVGELLEVQGRLHDAVKWAQAELNDFHLRNVGIKARCGRLLARCHAKLGEHALSVAALDAATQVTKVGEML
eukprot:g2181.t1